MQETLDAASELRGVGFRLGAVIVNRARPALVQPGQVDGDGQVDVEALARGLGRRRAGQGARRAAGRPDRRLRAAPGHADGERAAAGRRSTRRASCCPTQPPGRPRRAQGAGRLLRGGRRRWLTPSARRAAVAASDPRRRPAAVRPGHPHHRHLRQRRGRQDDHRGGAGAARGRGRAAHRRADHRPGPAAGPVDGPHRARQHPAPRSRRSSDGELFAMMLDMKRTFDEVVVAHSTPERAEQIFANPFYQSLSSSFAGTQEYMAMEKLSQLVAAARVGPHRRRHPAVAVGAGLPRRAQPARPLPRRADDPGADRAGAGRRQGVLQGRHRVDVACSAGWSPRSSAASC